MAYCPLPSSRPLLLLDPLFSCLTLPLSRLLPLLALLPMFGLLFSPLPLRPICPFKVVFPFQPLPFSALPLPTGLWYNSTAFSSTRPPAFASKALVDLDLHLDRVCAIMQYVAGG